MTKLAGMSLLLVLMSAQADDSVHLCRTHETCRVGQPCACTVIASSSDSRYFYFDVMIFIKGLSYTCALSGSPAGVRVAFGASKFPDGSIVNCNKKPCSSLPVTITLDTQHMVQSMDQASFKYFIPVSDTPHQIRIYCQSTETHR